MLRQRGFLQVDVFTHTPYLGNPLGVVLDGSGLSDEAMQQFARWTNLSETTFLLPPTPEARAQGADYQVRIFTPAYEMAFAGHPTVGSCHAWLAQGGVARDPDLIVQQCKVGLVKIRPSHTASGVRLAFAAPPLTRNNPSATVLARAAAALGLRADQIVAAQLMNNGPSHMGLLVDSIDTVLSITPNFSALQTGLPQWGVSGIGVVAMETPQGTQASANLIVRSNREARAFAGGSGAAQRPAQEPSAEVRFFFAGDNVVSEDRVTGSFNASLAQWLIAEGHAPRGYIAQQGCCLGGDGRVHIAIDDSDQVWVGGDAVTCISGMVTL